MPQFEARSAQLDMAQAVAARLENGGTSIIEAPTGVGKTLAYLVPALLSGGRVVVSTNTKTLQDQIVDKDLPVLAAIFEAAGWSLVRAGPDDPEMPPVGTMRYALMKGRTNYLCLDRLDKRTRQRSFSFDRGLIDDIRDWAAKTTRGDRAELVALDEQSSVWSEVDARSEVCHGIRCARYDDCFVVKMKREAERAQLIVVNHHLLLADLALRAEAQLSSGRVFGKVLPDADALIVDEAHSLEETASQYFGGQVSTRQLERFAKDAHQYLGEPGHTDVTALSGHVTAFVESVADVFAELPKGEGRTRIAPGSGPHPFHEARRQLRRVPPAYEALKDSLEVMIDTDVGAGAIARRARELTESLHFVISAEDHDFVYWSERPSTHATIGASPIHVSNLLTQFLFEAFDAVVLTSATLSTGPDRLQYFVEAVGAPEAEMLTLGSPFDFDRQSALYIPPDAPDPTQSGHGKHLARHAEPLIDLVDGGALFLFTSYRAMQAVHRQWDGRLRYPLLMQGQRPKRELLRAFVASSPAVLLATASFWEGVDIPGDPLRLVLIDRLPFDAPNDPLMAARAERLEAMGKRPFPSLHLPRAILRLKQGFGRLVRSKTDRGVVALLDRRVQTKGYGRRFLAALPPARQIRDFESLRQWWHDPDEERVVDDVMDELPW